MTGSGIEDIFRFGISDIFSKFSGSLHFLCQASKKENPADETQSLIKYLRYLIINALIYMCIVYKYSKLNKIAIIDFIFAGVGLP